MRDLNGIEKKLFEILQRCVKMKQGEKKLDYKDFTPKDVAYNKFLEYRKQIIDNADNGEFNVAFLDVAAKAIDGDCVAQDCLAYFFKRGLDEFKPNYEYYMSWEVLAAANGNEFAIEKLQFFLDVAVSEVIYTNEIIKTAMVRKNLTKDNAIVVISNLICEGIVDELGLDPKKLTDVNKKGEAYSASVNRKFVAAMENCLPAVAEFLIS